MSQSLIILIMHQQNQYHGTYQIGVYPEFCEWMRLMSQCSVLLMVKRAIQFESYFRLLFSCYRVLLRDGSQEFMYMGKSDAAIVIRGRITFEDIWYLFGTSLASAQYFQIGELARTCQEIEEHGTRIKFERFQPILSCFNCFKSCGYTEDILFILEVESSRTGSGFNHVYGPWYYNYIIREFVMFVLQQCYLDDLMFQFGYYYISKRSGI